MLKKDINCWFSGMTFIREEGKGPGNPFSTGPQGRAQSSANAEISRSQAPDNVCEAHGPFLPWACEERSCTVNVESEAPWPWPEAVFPQKKGIWKAFPNP